MFTSFHVSVYLYHSYLYTRILPLPKLSGTDSGHFRTALPIAPVQDLAHHRFFPRDSESNFFGFHWQPSCTSMSYDEPYCWFQNSFCSSYNNNHLASVKHYLSLNSVKFFHLYLAATLKRPTSVHLKTKESIWTDDGLPLSHLLNVTFFWILVISTWKWSPSEFIINWFVHQKYHWISCDLCYYIAHT